jgi:aldehyde:ferredoxin oxidoreductase
MFPVPAMGSANSGGETMDIFGWRGAILRVDLTTGQITRENLSEELRMNFIGGRGINSKLLFDETGPRTDPLGAENILIIGTGPINGTLAPSSGRFTVTAKSPYTGILGDANGGGDWSVELKYAGYDFLVVRGKADRPTYIFIDDGKVEVRDAQHLWGKDVWEVNRLLKKELRDDRVKVMCIGLAGENRVRFACPIVNAFHAPGRTGMGAVMGSKNLKAIAVRGSGSIRVPDPEKYLETIENIYKTLYEQYNFRTMSEIGTSCLIHDFNVRSCLAVKNNQINVLPEEVISPVYGEVFLKKYKFTEHACFGCPTHCSHFASSNEIEKGRRPEGGSILALGPTVGIFDFPFVMKAANLCTQYGLDTVSTGDVIGSAMEWYQEGIIDKKDTDGIELEWGNQKVVLDLIDKIARKDGFGALLAEGAILASKEIGKGAEWFVPHVKGLEKTTSRVDLNIGTLLSHCTDTRGMDHLRGAGSRAGAVKGKQFSPDSYDPERAGTVIFTEDICTGADILELCKFNTRWWIFDNGGGLEMMAELLSVTTGVNFSEKDLKSVCERIYNIERAYLVREGIRREDDLPPPRYIESPVPSGPRKGWKVDLVKFEKVLDEYYKLRGWDVNTGVPTREKLEELELSYVADELEKSGAYGKGA